MRTYNVTCYYCLSLVDIRNWIAHLKELCWKRPYDCKFCGKTFPWVEQFADTGVCYGCVDGMTKLHPPADEVYKKKTLEIKLPPSGYFMKR
jgi:hypothetical protein